MGPGSLRVGGGTARDVSGVDRTQPVRPTLQAHRHDGRAVRPQESDERSGGGRMEDGGLVPDGPSGRFIGHEAGRGCDGRRQDRSQRDPLVGAGGTRRGRRGGQRNAARATGARTRPGSPGTGLAGIVREQGGRARDQIIEPVEIELPVGSRGHQMVAPGPGGSRRAETVGQEQHECSRPPPPQPLVTTDGPDHNRNLAAARESPSGETTAGPGIRDLSESKRRDSDTCSNNIHRRDARFQDADRENRETRRSSVGEEKGNHEKHEITQKQSKIPRKTDSIPTCCHRNGRIFRVISCFSWLPFSGSSLPTPVAISRCIPARSGGRG
jgi:hypothetical protein